MKPRNREINIFNMSLLDILCGALGTFCFMMIVLFPYYSATPSNAPEMPKDMVDPKTLQEALNQIRQLKESLQKMQDYSMGLEGQVNQQKQQISQQQQQIQQLQQQIEDLKKQAAKNNEYTSRLEFRRPFMAISSFNSNKEDKWQVWWDSDRVRSDQKGPFKLLLNEPEDSHAFGGDMYGNTGVLSYHVIRDNMRGQYRLVLKLLQHDPSAMPMRGWVLVEMSDFRYLGPTMKISMGGPAIIPIATLELDQAPSEAYNFKWTFPPELNDEPDWKPKFPDRGKQNNQDKK